MIELQGAAFRADSLTGTHTENTQHPAIRSVIYLQSVGPQTEKDCVGVNVCAENSKEIKATMRRTTAASGLDGWGTQHNTTVLSLIQNTDTEQQPTRINSTCCVCYE